MHPLLALAALATWSLLGCAETAIELVMDLERRVPQEMDGLCLQLAGRGKSLYSEYFPLTPDRVGRAQTLTVLPGELNGQRFEVMLRAERSRVGLWSTHRTVSFATNEVRTERFRVGGCRGNVQTSATFARERRLTRFNPGSGAPEGAGAVVSALMVPSFPAQAVVAWSDADGAQAQRFIWDANEADSNRKVKRLEAGLPTPAGPLLAAISTDLDQEGEITHVCSPDFVMLQKGSNAIWAHNGDGSFDALSASLPLSQQLLGGVSADLDGDGLADLALASAAGVAVLINSGGGRYVHQPAATPTSDLDDATSVAVGLLDGDTSPDLVVGRGADKPAVLLLNDGQGSFAVAGTDIFEPPGKTTTSVAIGRFDGDELDDIVLAHEQDVEIYRQQAGGFVVDSTLIPTSAARDNVAQLVAGDIDNDCRDDLLLVRPGKTQVLANQQGTRLRLAGEILGGTNAVTTDFDGDGRLDVLVGGNASGAFFIQQCPEDNPTCGQ